MKRIMLVLGALVVSAGVLMAEHVFVKRALCIRYVITRAF